MGMGAMTGRGAGFCAGFGVPGYANQAPGRGMGRGRGFRGFAGSAGAGRGWQMNSTLPPSDYNHPPTQQDELSVLKSRLHYFTEALENVGKRIEELEAREQ